MGRGRLASVREPEDGPRGGNRVLSAPFRACCLGEREETEVGKCASLVHLRTQTHLCSCLWPHAGSLRRLLQAGAELSLAHRLQCRP